MIILAKDDGTTLYDHSKKVYEFSKYLCATYFFENKKYQDIIKYSSLLHDIGKCTNNFQSKLKKNKDAESNKSNYLHNEISWAFVSKYLNISHNIKDEICNIIYWHHGIINKQNNYFDADILKHISDEEIEIMKNETISLLNDNNIINIDLNDDKKSPKYLSSEYGDKNDDLILLRSCIICADRFVSKHNNLEINELIKLYEQNINKNNTYNFSTSSYSNSDRFLEQKQIVNDCDITTLVKAPAGFGKTLIGLLWSRKNNKKTIWVCPRNTVAHSVYNSILQEMKEFNVHINIELFLSGEVIKKNNESADFNSDIIITNIDNLLKPTIDNSTADLSFFINMCNVIFDEYHELVQENALFSLFISLMKIRHRKTNANTLLLSATPINLNSKWDSLGKKTKILPNENSHYNSAHNKKYLIKIHNSFDTIKINDTNSLIILNSIKNAQLNKQNNCDIIHGLYEKQTKDKKFKCILEKYGKNNKELNKQNLIGTHILQASLDISFKYLYESILSPESTLQRIGRCNRWGNYDDCEIHIFNYDEKGENIIKNSLYTKDLNNKWYNYIKELDNKYVTLNDIYEKYNNFNILYKKEINEYIDSTLRQSKNSLDSIYPIKFFNNTKEKSDIKTAGSNKLRSSGNEIFYICKKTNGEYSDVFNKKILYNISDEFDENQNSTNFIIKTMESLINDTRFDYESILNNNKRKKNITSEHLKYHAKKSNTPYIRFDVVYDEVYGIIKTENLEIITNNNK